MKDLSKILNTKIIDHIKVVSKKGTIDLKKFPLKEFQVHLSDSGRMLEIILIEKENEDNHQESGTY